MARRGRRRRGGNRRRIRRSWFGGMIQTNNAVIKGTITYGANVSINFGDFSDLPTGQFFPQSIRITVTLMNGPSYLAISQWDGGNDNSYFTVTNRLLNPRQTFSKTYRWPKTPFAIISSKSVQTLIVINHCPGGDVYGSDKPIMFYMASIIVKQAGEELDTTVDPPHQNIKHGTPSLLSMVEDL